MLNGPCGQVVEEYGWGGLRHWHQSLFPSLAPDPHHPILQVQVFYPKVYPLTGTQAAIEHQNAGRMYALLVGPARLKMKELFDTLNRKDAANPLLSFLLGKFDAALDVFELQHPVHERLTAADVGVGSDRAGTAFADRGDAIPELLAQLAFVGRLAHAIAEGFPATAVPDYGGIGNISVGLPARDELHEEAAVFARKVGRGLCPTAVIHIVRLHFGRSASGLSGLLGTVGNVWTDCTGLPWKCLDGTKGESRDLWRFHLDANMEMTDSERVPKAATGLLS